MRGRALGLAGAVLLWGAAVGMALGREQPPPEPPPQPTEILEQVVVSASATEEQQLDAPAAVDVLTGEQLQVRPGDHLVDHLRRVPGINVIQFSARDLNIASRSATGGINNSTVALIDGRNLYQDFLGFIMWEFAPNDMALIDRVEVVRGPASALWGANAVGGLVHVLTKSPLETPGGRFELGAGDHGMARIDVSDSFRLGPWALRLAGGLYQLDAFERPSTIENVFGERVDPDLGLLADGFRDSGTEQPRFDLRADYGDPLEGGRWVLQAGAARTRGWIATGLGPFDVDPSTAMSYVQGRWARGGLETQVYLNHFDGSAKNLINAIDFDFTSDQVHYGLRGQSVLGRRAVAGWGTELDRSTYDLSIAPGGRRRSRAGLFGEVDVSVIQELSFVASARYDYVRETIGGVLSPRLALRFKPTPWQTMRFAWGRAFRSPSVLESDLFVPAIPVARLDWEAIDATLDPQTFPGGFFAPLAQVVCGGRPDNCGASPGETPDYIAVTAARGDRDLEEETTDSYELGYAARLGRFGLSAAVYRTRSRNGIDFPQRATYGYGPDRLPGTADDIIFPTDPQGDGIEEAPAVDVCPYVEALPPFRDLCPQGPVPYNQFLSIVLDGRVPALFQYANGATTENRGIELGLNWTGPHGFGAALNWSWQEVPRSDRVKMTDRIDNLLAETAGGTDLDGDGQVADTSEFVNISARNRLSLSLQLDRPRWFAGASWDHVDRTFWQDVLTSTFWGWVPSYDLVGLRAGWRFQRPRLELTGQVTNLLDKPIQQHIFGDILGRRVAAFLGYRWGG
ncbi:MAG TPA: TonB-dependent receptor [Candidatus Polarisedimenticolaceae bacterium]|nr:TonB-dependent receptor [Candidatus Polarisedimenticolaceae bacterium]